MGAHLVKRSLVRNILGSGIIFKIGAILVKNDSLVDTFEYFYLFGWSVFDKLNSQKSICVILGL